MVLFQGKERRGTKRPGRLKLRLAGNKVVFAKNLSLISARSEAVLKFYVFRSFSILPGLLSHFIGQFSNITPQSCQTLGLGRSSLQPLMDVGLRERAGAGDSEPHTSVPARTVTAPHGCNPALVCAPPPWHPPRRGSVPQWLGAWLLNLTAGHLR